MSTKSDFIRCRVEPELKKQAEQILSELGLNTTQAITLFYQQIALRHGLPFAVEIPNAQTPETFEASENTAWELGKDLFDKHDSGLKNLATDRKEILRQKLHDKHGSH